MEHRVIEVSADNAIKIIKRSDACIYGLRFGFPDLFWDEMEGRLPVVGYHTKDTPLIKINNQYVTVESPRRYILLHPNFFKSLIQTEAGAHVIEFFGRNESYKVTIQWAVPYKAPVPWTNCKPVTPPLPPVCPRPCTNIQLSVEKPKNQVEDDIWYQDITSYIDNN